VENPNKKRTGEEDSKNSLEGHEKAIPTSKPGHNRNIKKLRKRQSRS
jgi:hypothetical protein